MQKESQKTDQIKGHSKVFLGLMFSLSVLGYLALQNGWWRGGSNWVSDGLTVKALRNSNPVFQLPVLNAELFPNVGREGVLSSRVFENQPTLIYFWSSWCKKCRGERFLPPLFRRFSEQLNIFVSASFDSAERISRAPNEIKRMAPLLHDLDGAFAKKYGVEILPQTVLLDADHKIVSRVNGPLTQETVRALEQNIEKLLKSY